MTRLHCLPHAPLIPTEFPARPGVFARIGFIPWIGILAWIGFFGVLPSLGQSSPSEVPFNTMRVGVASGMIFRDSGIPGWSPGPDVRLTVDTPYAGGRLRLDGAFRTWTGRKNASGVIDLEGNQTTADLPDVQAIDILAGWGLSNADDAPISLDAGLLLGNRFMLFDLPKASAGRFESEMLAGPWIRIGRVSGPVRLFVEIRALRVLTQPRWDTIGISGGIAFETTTPGWIRWILQ